MIRRIQQLPRTQRIIVFVVTMVGGILLLVVLTVALILGTLNAGRDQSVALVDGVTVREFAVLPDDDAYPATVAVGLDGTVYTGSYASGAIWSITSDGTLSEIPGTRDAIGSVSGLAVDADGVLYIVDQDDSNALTLGGSIRRMEPNGTITTFDAPDDEQGWLLPDDITLDAQGRIYVSDRGRREVWRYEADGTNGSVWWTAPESNSETRPAPTGLAYDPAADAILITDSNLDAIDRVFIATGETERLYVHGRREHAPGLDGITVAPDGMIYAAALAQNGLVRLTDGELEYIAGLFRGISDVAYFDGKIYAANFDSFSLVVPMVRPRLPFALDVVELTTP